MNYKDQAKYIFNLDDNEAESIIVSFDSDWTYDVQNGISCIKIDGWIIDGSEIDYQIVELFDSYMRVSPTKHFALLTGVSRDNNELSYVLKVDLRKCSLYDKLYMRERVRLVCALGEKGREELRRDMCSRIGNDVMGSKYTLYDVVGMKDEYRSVHDRLLLARSRRNSI